MSQVQPEDLLAYGLIPEFVGRVPVIATLDLLSDDDLFRILTEPKNAIIQQCQRLFEIDGVEIQFTEEALLRSLDTSVHVRVTPVGSLSQQVASSSQHAAVAPETASGFSPVVGSSPQRTVVSWSRERLELLPQISNATALYE